MKFQAGLLFLSLILMAGVFLVPFALARASVVSLTATTAPAVTAVAAGLAVEKSNLCHPLPMIMYHYIEDIPAASSDIMRKRLATSPADLKAELAALQAAGYRSYFINEVPRYLQASSVDRGVVLTFDDGYQDFYTAAFPLLQKYHFKATMYIVYNLIGKPGYMTQNQIKEIIASGLVELGSHGMDHIDLGKASFGQAKSQIFLSKEKLEQTFGVLVQTFAFPSGRYNAKTIEFVWQAGYLAAASTIPGICQTSKNIFLLRRYRASLFTPKNIISRLQHFYGLAAH